MADLGRLYKTNTDDVEIGVVGQRCAEYAFVPPDPPPPTDPEPPDGNTDPPDVIRPKCIWEPFNYTIGADGVCYVSGVRAKNSPCDDSNKPSTPYPCPCSEVQ